jgi:hypothetical protein
VGLSEDHLRESAQKGISLVWSPFSNLLLYGETLDVDLAKRLGINLAIGADWSPTGSKNLLDELKIARRYLNKNRITTITDEDLVKMATINAAKAIRRDSVVGRIAEGYLADLILVKKAKTVSAYTSLVEATQAEINLVVINGQPIYGEVNSIQKVAKTLGDASAPEIMANGAACTFKKAMRLPFGGDYDRGLAARPGAPKLLSFSGISTELKTKFDAYATQIKAAGNARATKNLIPGIDAVYNCEDTNYSKRFMDYIGTELDQNNQSRRAARALYKLDDNWSPIKSTGEGTTTID